MTTAKNTEANAPARFWIWVDKRGPGDCWVWQGVCQSTGYGRFARVPGHQGSAHRYSYELHNGPIPPGLLIMHSCDNPPCVNPSHLRAGTHADNMADKARKGRCNPRPRTFKLTEDDVREIRRLYNSGGHNRYEPSNVIELAERFGVRKQTVEAIANRRERANVE